MTSLWWRMMMMKVSASGDWTRQAKRSLEDLTPAIHVKSCLE